ncbi:MAG: FG-GAP repeat protein [Phycisphaerae bacterium]|jgi:hypothetical protein
MQQFSPVHSVVTLVVTCFLPLYAYGGVPLAKLLPESGDEADFGTAVAMSGTTVIVGAPAVLGTSPPAPGVGSAYLFDISDITNGTRTPFQADDGAPGDGFGISVGISGTTAIVGAVDADDTPARAGAAYVFDVTDPADPQQTAKLISDDSGIYCSGVVAISGTTALVGALSATGNLVYLFDISDPADPIRYELRPDKGHAGDQFGSSLAISGTKAIVGAISDDDNGEDSGAAYVFDVSDPADPAQVKVFADGGVGGEFFGASVAISGTTAVIGAPAAFGGAASSAYLLDLTDPANPTQTELPFDGGTAGQLFGFSVAIGGTTAIVGVPAVLGASGSSAHLFDTTDPANPLQGARLMAYDGNADDAFGISVATSGNIALVGAAGDDKAGVNAGSAYLFLKFSAFPNCMTGPGQPVRSECAQIDLDLNGTVDLRDFGVLQVFSGSE